MSISEEQTKSRIDPMRIPNELPMDFVPGGQVVDIGCGYGNELMKLLAMGYQAEGVEYDPALVAKLREEGLPVQQGGAEKLPLEADSYDGILCNVVLPYTEERLAVAEWGRVLKSGGIVHVTYHFFGYPLRQFILGPGIKGRFYGLRTILNAWWYRLTGRRFKRWGDTLYQSTSVLNKYYTNSGLELVEEVVGRRFLGFPRFVYHQVRKK